MPEQHQTCRVAGPLGTQNDYWPPQVKYVVGNEACERFSHFVFSFGSARYCYRDAVAARGK